MSKQDIGVDHNHDGGGDDHGDEHNDDHGGGGDDQPWPHQSRILRLQCREDQISTLFITPLI